MGALALVGLAVAYLVSGPPPAETVLEAESVLPYTQPIPPRDVAPEPPSMLAAPIEPALPRMPPGVMEPGSAAGSPAGPTPVLAALLPERPYVGPRAPEYTGSPAPTGLGLLDGRVFGHQVLGMHPELLTRLQRVEGDNPRLGVVVDTIVAYRRGNGSHGQGLAVDINYFANPYLMHESGEAQRDSQLGPVYHRIATVMLGRPSVIPEAITQGTVSPNRTQQLFRLLRDESRAMVGYFRLMQDREALERHLATRGAASGPLTAAALQQQMVRDYVTLSGRSGPPVSGLEYPMPEVTAGEPPFAGDPTYRGPELGFLNLTEELVQALTDSGLRWGGTDMGANSGDLMHFYLPSSAVTKSLGMRRSGENLPGGARK